MTKVLIMLIALLGLGCAEYKAVDLTYLNKLKKYCADTSWIKPVQVFDFRSLHKRKKHKERVLLFDAGNTPEQVPCIDSKAGVGTPKPKYKLMQVELRNIKQGMVLEFNTYGEVTNEHPEKLMVAWYSSLSTDKDGKNVLPGELSEPRGYNLSREMHHGTWSDSGQYVFKGNYERIFLTVFIYSASLEAWDYIPGLLIDRDYGRLYGRLYE
jgi:hypothetical protein